MPKHFQKKVGAGFPSGKTQKRSNARVLDATLACVFSTR
ncbi:hypothetical protein SY94_2690 [Agrobacterium tumefaciens]|nr:hypothetical protein SY94_2690 [Agrobacterium tumefaciens]